MAGRTVRARGVAIVSGSDRLVALDVRHVSRVTLAPVLDLGEYLPYQARMHDTETATRVTVTAGGVTLTL